MNLPSYITHYFEKDYGPFLNVCDLSESSLAILIEKEKDAPTEFNRFAIGSDFFAFRRTADDLLIRLYTEKFGRKPEGRPYYATLGTFDRTLNMFRSGEKIALPISDFELGEITFMYPDHAHLVSLFDVPVPRYGYQLPEEYQSKRFFGRIFTHQELVDEYEELAIQKEIESCHSKDWWAGSYVEAHIWRRNLKRANPLISIGREAHR